jgi:amino acid transporter
MSYDRCLPQFLRHKNKLFKSNHYVILTFLLLTSSLYAIVGGHLTSLEGVFAVSFLGVMCMFAMGNLVLKYKRPRLPRPIRAHWALVLLGLASMLAGLTGNLVLKPEIFRYFAIYFCVPMVLVAIYLDQVRLVKMLLFLIERTPLHERISPYLHQWVRKMKEMTVIFFTRTDEIHIINKAILYAHHNEHIDRVKLIHLYETESQVPRHLVENHYILDHLYPKIQIDLHLIKGTFEPDIIPQLSAQFKVPPNFMFMRCPGQEFKHKIGDFGGVRMIMA